jgi:pimeloyl-ACP methyl ester carboxylesterase
MRREQIRIGRRQIGYLISETPAPGARQQPLRNVVFLHAFPLSAQMWRPQIDVVPAGWRMIAPDYRGFGQSSPSDSPETTMKDLAGDLIDLLDHLEIHEAVVAGCSMGGYVAFELLASAPHYVKGLVLIDTRAGADSEEGKAGRRKMLEKVDTGGSEVIASEMTPKLLGATSQRESPGLVKQVQEMIRSTDPAAIKMAVTAMMERKDMTASLNDVKVPALVIAGAEDTLIPLAAAEEMHRAIPRSAFEIIPLAGHLPNLEQATAFDVALQRFLGRF